MTYKRHKHFVLIERLLVSNRWLRYRLEFDEWYFTWLLHELGKHGEVLLEETP